ncbi:pyridoxamine 5'-phosphate oxidase family protein [Mucilaginibacter sp. AW1-7]|uniref:pyridoxamine 5'-phosphate oxidase family protein n=1 Tax=unclassified Mucilaginibacter TaxID=2617802 RepID=UPI0008D72A78|nr:MULTISPECIES: pyridoxamine 5'-phosphate oxidase family protein [unclassified Mucilaginibacter]WDF80156.1 pyridoxamine 5'-phosphate oxidase family protein [Mucilaginibacter sp. KACC 22773]SEO72975.1 General stress protein 26 [Mucilaginibacter sp. OK283]
MDSINQQQPEDNYQDLGGPEAIAKLKDMVDSAKSCFFLTNIKTGIPANVRPMSVQQVDDEGNLWFLSANDSHKNEDLQKDPMVHLLFQGSAHSDFLNVYGIATVSEDKEKIKELWEPILKVWFTDGIDDPRISVIKVEPTESYYWDNKHGNAIAFVKMLAGAAIGKTFDDSIEGKINV